MVIIKCYRGALKKLLPGIVKLTCAMLKIILYANFYMLVHSKLSLHFSILCLHNLRPSWFYETIHVIQFGPKVQFCALWNLCLKTTCNVKGSTWVKNEVRHSHFKSCRFRREPWLKNCRQWRQNLIKIVESMLNFYRKRRSISKPYKYNYNVNAYIRNIIKSDATK